MKERDEWMDDLNLVTLPTDATKAFDIIANQVQVKEKPLLRQRRQEEGGGRRRRLTLWCSDEA
jgi:hypothetical protein